MAIATLRGTLSNGSTKTAESNAENTQVAFERVVGFLQQIKVVVMMLGMLSKRLIVLHLYKCGASR